ncbi:MAG: gfo/Idh/MocA family oxidoreductase [Planctomycetota bacterium]|nr:Gfo/Idh/MocA family oxidoreductase [Planctomycetales bacterium]RLT11753.1 MAG: gfo/Idh/MocA family oxidoreductase [Planctomycetota bacterium]
MNRVKLAVVGVGALGQHHARILSTMPDVHLVGVVDSREQQGRQIAAKHGTQWFASPAQILPLVQGVIIAVPTIFHQDVGLPFLEAGIAVLMEKPLAHSLQAAQTLQRMAVFRRSILQVGHVERFNPAFELLQEKIERPLYIRAQRLSPYTFRSTDIGVVHDLMIHDIDLVLALTGDSIVSVDTFGAVTFGPHEDMAVARLKTSSGIIADITASRMSPVAERTIQVFSTNGCVTADLNQRTVSRWQPVAPLAANPSLVHDIIAATPDPTTLKNEVFQKWITNETLQASSVDALTAELTDFVRCIRTDGRPRVSGEDAVRALEVADRILAGIAKWSWQDKLPNRDAAKVA